MSLGLMDPWQPLDNISTAACQGFFYLLPIVPLADYPSSCSYCMPLTLVVGQTCHQISETTRIELTWKHESQCYQWITILHQLLRVLSLLRIVFNLKLCMWEKTWKFIVFWFTMWTSFCIHCTNISNCGNTIPYTISSGSKMVNTYQLMLSLAAQWLSEIYSHGTVQPLSTPA